MKFQAVRLLHNAEFCPISVETNSSELLSRVLVGATILYDRWLALVQLKMLMLKGPGCTLKGVVRSVTRL